jgi:DNA-binding PadR family transcriptional regulator
LTEIDIRKKVNKKMHTTVARSRIYDILDDLYKDEWVHRRYSREDSARRYSLAFNWASVGLNEDYDKNKFN